MKVIHIMHRSVPGTSGYAIRSREIVKKQLAHGLQPIVVTSPSQAPLGELDSEKSEIIDGIRYFRSCGKWLTASAEVYDPSNFRSALRVAQNVRLVTMVASLARKFKPDVIHSHSPFTCGLTGDTVGSILRIPTIYETRASWEDSHLSRKRLTENSMTYRLMKNLETLAMKGANLRIAISKALKKDIIDRGFSPEQVEIVPNGVNLDQFVPGPASSELKDRLGLQDRIVLGYIGSFFYYEGLDLLIKAMAKLRPHFDNLMVLLVGSGEAEAELRSLTKQLEIDDRVTFVGRVSHNEVQEYYRLADILCLPRIKSRLTDLVTPLKPVEIMAMEKPLLASDVGGHLETLVENVNGMLFRADELNDFITKLTSLITNEQLRIELGKKARIWVSENLDWEILTRKYVSIYTRLIT
ncbi:MAG: glycosyltransferase [Syntrophaceae bacterium]|nr:glycosyltransferase [Syntrophaceae bacterium]